MKIRNIQQAEYIEQQGLPVLRLLIDGKEAILDTFSLNGTLVQLGYVYLGEEWEKRISAPLPADPADNRGEEQLRGFTTDPRVVALASTFLRDVSRGTARLGPIPLPPSFVGK